MFTMTPKLISSYRIDEELIEAMRSVYERDGISVPEQVRRAVREWLKRRGVKVKAERKRPASRKRS